MERIPYADENTHKKHFDIILLVLFIAECRYRPVKLPFNQWNEYINEIDRDWLILRRLANDYFKPEFLFLLKYITYLLLQFIHTVTYVWT